MAPLALWGMWYYLLRQPVSPQGNSFIYKTVLKVGFIISMLQIKTRSLREVCIIYKYMRLEGYVSRFCEISHIFLKCFEYNE